MKLLRLFSAIILCFLFVAPMQSVAKEQPTESSDVDESLNGYNKQLWQRDFSALWTVKQLPSFDDSMNNIRPEPIGYIGPYFQRFYIHFLEVCQSKEIPAQYQVRGKTKFKDRVCDFTGTFTIQSIACGPEQQFGTGEYLTVMDEILGDRRLRFGTIKGSYALKENPQQEQSGVLRGTFVTNFLVNEQGEIAYNNLKAYSDSYCNNWFEGTWTPHCWARYHYCPQHSRVCNWGDYRIPCSLDLDIGAGEFSPSDEFLAYGWETYRAAYVTAPSEAARQAALKKEEEAWWK